VYIFRKLLDPQFSSYSKPALFLNLLYKSMKADLAASRVKAFMKRLLQVACVQQPSLTCGSLYLISEILQHRPGISMMDFFEVRKWDAWNALIMLCVRGHAQMLIWRLLLTLHANTFSIVARSLDG